MISKVKQNGIPARLRGMTSRTTFFLALAIFGALITNHYGESWDEAQFYQYAEHALESYPSWFEHGEVIVTGNTYDNYGPAFVIFTSTLARWAYALLPNVLISDLRHIIYFLTFLASVWAFHDIALRWIRPPAAFAATLLFLTQPLFWGHAFISPKDIPFMSLFLLSLAMGLRMADNLENISFNSFTPASRQTLVILTVLWFVIVFGPFIFTDTIHTLISDLVQAAKSGGTNIITYIASDLGKVESETYIRRYFVFFLHLRSLFFILFSVIIIYVYYRQIPSILHSLRPVLLPAIVLGLATSIRILAPLVGLLVIYYFLGKNGRQAIPALILYATIAVITMYLTWPYLWPDPVGRFLESAKVMSQYPWKGQVLFNGSYYASNHLPYSYLPVLLLIQFTETVWPLFVIGLFAVRKNSFMLILILFWFVLPLLALIFAHAPLYDNTRQIFFILPPIFLAAGAGIDLMLGRLGNLVLQKMLVGLLILPGLIAGIRLHPYEYVYYNSLVGDPTGRFELDYWATSYREGVHWLNANAPANAQVVAGDPDHLVELYLREDLKSIPASEFMSSSSNFALYSTRYKADENLFSEYETVREIGRDGLIFAVIKKLR